MAKEKLTVAQKIRAKKLKRPPAAVYRILGGVWKLLFEKKYGVSYEFKEDFRKEKGPYIVVSNHASRLDYIFTGIPLLPNCYNYVAGYNEFHRSHLAGVFSLLQVIPKKNFMPDIYTIKQVKRILDDGGKVFIFPEGMSSISGANQPVAIGTGKFIKHFRVPIYYTKIRGGYLSSPKYNLTDRYGRVEVTLGKLLSPEEIDELTPEQIEAKLNEELYHDDYAWNKEKKYVYKNNGKIAENLEDLLYVCPKCGKEFTMKGEGDKITCSACGNGATMDDYYQFQPFENAVIPESPFEWVEQERRDIIKEIRENPDYFFEDDCKIGNLDEYKLVGKNQTSFIVGEGKIRVDHKGMHYKGTRNGEPFEFTLDYKTLYTLITTVDASYFNTYYKGEYFDVYPKGHTVGKFCLLVEEMHRYHVNFYKNFKWNDDMYEGMELGIDLK